MNQTAFFLKCRFFILQTEKNNGNKKTTTFERCGFLCFYFKNECAVVS